MPRILDRAFANEHPGYYNNTLDDTVVPIVALEKIVSSL